MLGILSSISFIAFIIWIGANGAYILQHVPMEIIFSVGSVSCWVFVLSFIAIWWMAKKGE